MEVKRSEKRWESEAEPQAKDADPILFELVAVEIEEQRDLDGGFEEEVLVEDELEPEGSEDFGPAGVREAGATRAVSGGEDGVEFGDEVEGLLVVALVAGRVEAKVPPEVGPEAVAEAVPFGLAVPLADEVRADEPAPLDLGDGRAKNGVPRSRARLQGHGQEAPARGLARAPRRQLRPEEEGSLESLGPPCLLEEAVLAHEREVPDPLGAQAWEPASPIEALLEIGSRERDREVTVQPEDGLGHKGVHRQFLPHPALLHMHPAWNHPLPIEVHRPPRGRDDGVVIDQAQILQRVLAQRNRILAALAKDQEETQGNQKHSWKRNPGENHEGMIDPRP